MSAHSQALINITEDGASVDDDLTDNNEEEAVSSARQHATYIPLDPNDASSRGYCSICGPDKDNVEVVRKFSSVTPTKGELKKRRDRIFKTRQSFNQHRRQMHGTKAQKDTKLICPADNCKQECSSYNALIEHLNVTHRILCYSESRRFANIQKFDAWIQQLEFDSKCSFVSDGGIH
uniref:C2H2-type domain-containing protein n=1 Tax=Plectus sambesii TaxID=2011161 RepID=A0A914XHL9_9BILA